MEESKQSCVSVKSIGSDKMVNTILNTLEINNGSIANLNLMYNHTQEGVEKCFERIEQIEKRIDFIADIVSILNKAACSTENCLNEVLVLIGMLADRMDALENKND